MKIIRRRTSKAKAEEKVEAKAKTPAKAAKEPKTKAPSKKSKEPDDKKDYVQFGVGYSKYVTLPSKKFLQRKRFVPANPKILSAFIPGTIFEVRTEQGAEVKAGACLLILDAMKMRNKILAPFDGKIKVLNVEKGEIVKKNHLLIELE